MHWFGLLSSGLALLCCTSAFVTHRKGDVGELEPGVDEGEDNVFLAPRSAKSFLRVRRGWNIKSAWGEEQEEESESRENNAEHARAAAHARSCAASCWGSWGGFSACSTPCGSSGIQHSYRQRSPPSQCAGWVNQNGCPGTNQRSQACNRACQNGGSLRPTDCECPAGYRGTCCEHRVTCGYPGKSANGEVSPSGSSHVYGTVVTFSCHTGYSLVGGATKTCQNNGQWSGGATPPTCQIVSCGEPATPVNGGKQGSTYIYGSSVVYACTTGYNLQGSKTVTCQANGQWSSGVPTCAVVTCPGAEEPTNGWSRMPNGHTYQTVAEYGCSTGYHLQGPRRRTCLVSGQWDGTQPTCQAIICPVLDTPSHGSVSFSSRQDDAVQYDSTANFRCESGYNINGLEVRTCSGSGPAGVWTDDQPTCEPVNCGTPSTPAHGTRSGNAFTYPNTISYQCLPGYFLEGTDSLTCGSDGSWQGTAPGCSACPQGTFKSGSNADNQCASCPAHTHTTAEASAEVEQCICDEGYLGPAGGPCTEILCPPMEAPQHGSLGSCDIHVGDVCNFECEAGYIRSQGEGQRTCRLDGTWSGSSPTCSACPQNTYKSSSTLCEVCPANTETVGEANELEGCVCKEGFNNPSTDGSCQDIDECNENNGGCEQTCENLAGSYHCTCTLPGYIQDADNATRCASKNQCADLAEPDNGGLVCVAERRTNTERCEVKCNPGYDHIMRINTYEECGPSTNWMWTNEVSGTAILPCIAQYFSGVSMETEVAYFIDSCDLLSSEQVDAIKLQFIQLLNQKGICIVEEENVCSIDDVTIDCGAIGEFFFRKKRSATSPGAALRIKFNIRVDSVSQNEVNCSDYCNSIQVLNDYCNAICMVKKQEQDKNRVRQEAVKIQELFRNSVEGTVEESQGNRPPAQNVTSEGPTDTQDNQTVSQGMPVLRIGDIVLTPFPRTSLGEAHSSCGQGMERSNEMCVPCPPGTYLSSSTNQCEMCEINTYQPQPQQLQCLPCPETAPMSHQGETQCHVVPTPELPPGLTSEEPRELFIDLWDQLPLGHNPNHARP